jgi:superfamily I DNA/RNA helicase
MAAAYLDALNPEQRQAVEHGVEAGRAEPAAPLLIIAGAGSGKTNTLAHRVAHLIVNGADPRRILLMTFSRRAASEMIGRVERIGRRVMGDKASVRLLYVAMTRAKADLHIMLPQRFFTHGQPGDRHVYASRTRFIPKGLLGLFEKTTWPMAAPAAATTVLAQAPRVDVAQRLRSMWQVG